MMTENRYRMIQWGKVGAWQGAKWGFRLAVLYMLGTTLCLGGVSLWATTTTAMLSGNTDALTGVFMGMLFLPAIWFFGLLVAVMPATFVGLVVGTIVGMVTALPSIHHSRRVRRGMGLGTVVIVELAMQSAGVAARGITIAMLYSEGSFWYFVGVPFLFCLGMVFWLTGKLPRLADTPRLHETIAGERPVPPPLWLE